MPIAGGIALLIVGAILTFALTDGSVQGLNLRIVGAILMLAGALTLLLPFLVRGRPRSNRPAARSRQDAIDDGEITDRRGRPWTTRGRARPK